MRILKLVLVCLLAVGLVFMASNSFAKVALVYGATEKVTDMDPANAYVQIDLAQLDAEQNNFTAATERINKLDPKLRSTHDVAALLAKMEFASAAESSRDKASLLADIEKDPKNSEARYQLAAICITEGDYQTALDQLLQILIRDRHYKDDGGRQAMLSIFDMLGDDHELVGVYRRKMFNAMH